MLNIVLGVCGDAPLDHRCEYLNGVVPYRLFCFKIIPVGPLELLVEISLIVAAEASIKVEVEGLQPRGGPFRHLPVYLLVNHGIL